MSSGQFPTARGTVSGISAGAPATLDAAGYSALTYTEVAELADAPQMGATFSVATRTPVKTGIQEQSPGDKQYGTVTLNVTNDLTDAGQLIVKAHAPDGGNEGEPVSWQVVTPNKDGLTTTDYMCGFIVGFQRQTTDSNTIISATIEVAVNHQLRGTPA